jgi:serine phosphatase RsbU (regulator of sigma subunit)
MSTHPPPLPLTLQTWHAEREAFAQVGPCGDQTMLLPFSAGRIALVVIDVTGHGPARARLCVLVADAITTSLRYNSSPANALVAADAQLRESGDEHPYAVAFVAVADPRNGLVRYASAGHDCAFVLDDRGGLRHLAQTAPMLGIPLALQAYDAFLRLGADETLVIATDGIAESRPPGTVDFFAADGTARAVRRSLQNGSDPARATLDAACNHACGTQINDAAIVVANIRRGRS